MQDMVRVVVDAMGGDNAPGEIVKGAVEALNARENRSICSAGILVNPYRPRQRRKSF